jgi:hypothetical protein
LSFIPVLKMFMCNELKIICKPHFRASSDHGLSRLNWNKQRADLLNCCLHEYLLFKLKSKQEKKNKQNEKQYCIRSKKGLINIYIQFKGVLVRYNVRVLQCARIFQRVSYFNSSTPIFRAMFLYCLNLPDYKQQEYFCCKIENKNGNHRLVYLLFFPLFSFITEKKR